MRIHSNRYGSEGLPAWRLAPICVCPRKSGKRTNADAASSTSGEVTMKISSEVFEVSAGTESLERP